MYRIKIQLLNRVENIVGIGENPHLPESVYMREKNIFYLQLFECYLFFQVNALFSRSFISARPSNMVGG